MLQGAAEQQVKMAAQVSIKWFSKGQPSASTQASIWSMPSTSTGEPVKVEKAPVASPLASPAAPCESSNTDNPIPPASYLIQALVPVILMIY